MFDIGFSEMIIIAVVALIAIGPKQLPEVARVVGRFMAELRRMANDFTRTLTDVRESTNSLIQNTQRDIEQSMFQHNQAQQAEEENQQQPELNLEYSHEEFDHHHYDHSEAEEPALQMSFALDEGESAKKDRKAHGG